MGRVVIRTVWLGLALLVCLIGLASFKLAIGSPRPMAVVQAAAASRDVLEIGTSPVPETLTKGDRLPVTYISFVEPLATELQVPPEPTSIAAPKIISRHWHDPSDPTAAQGGIKKPKSKDLKNMPAESNASRRHRRLATRMGVAHSSGSSAPPRPAATDRTQKGAVSFYSVKSGCDHRLSVQA